MNQPKNNTSYAHPTLLERLNVIAWGKNKQNKTRNCGGNCIHSPWGAYKRRLKRLAPGCKTNRPMVKRSACFE